MIPQWYQFGCALGVSIEDLNNIEEEDNYMISMLEEWKENHEENYTWETLQDALRVIGNNRLGANLEKHRLKDEQGHYYNLEVHENRTPHYITCTF